jgi:hypothetical protein
MNMKFLSAIFCFFLVFILSLPSSLWARNYGLFVGIDNYESPGNALTSCVNDAIGFRNALLFNNNKWNLADTTVMVDEEATKQGIVEKLAVYASALSAGDLFVYFHSGHGGSLRGTTSTFLYPHDETAFWDSELATSLSAFEDGGIDVIVVVDACNSGGLFQDEFTPSEPLSKSLVLSQTESSLSASSWPFGANVISHMKVLSKTTPLTGSALSKSLTKDDVVDPAETAFITAVDFDELSYTGTPYSLFCNYLIDGFRLADDSSYGDNDDETTFWELFQYAYSKTTGDPDSEGMTPQFYNQSFLERIVANNQLLVAPQDPYETDDSLASASNIVDGEVQWHSILPVGDEDYVKFTLTSRSEVTVFTDGTNFKTDGTLVDTEIFLYDSTEPISPAVTPPSLATNDDRVGDGFSALTMTLSSGTYYIRVIQYGGTDTIEAYSLNVTVEPVIPVVPVVVATGDGGGGCALGNSGSRGASNFLGFMPLIILVVFALRRNWTPGFIPSSTFLL